MEHKSETLHGRACSCCNGLLQSKFSRRNFVMMGAGAGAALMLKPYLALAASGDYEAMVLSCIDPRFQELVRTYMNDRGLSGKYSQFVFAGAAIGVVAPAFNDWHKAFWDNLAASIQLHNIKRVIAIDHRDCGAAKIAYGDAKVVDRTIETATHSEALGEFRQQAAVRQPKLMVETLLIDLNGTVEVIA